jgi:hypothetical protein
MDDEFLVILHRTSKDWPKEGTTSVTKDEGIRIVDREGPKFASFHLCSSFAKKGLTKA